MAATVHVLHKRSTEIGSFLRVGHTGHRKLESLIAASRLRFRRFVFDASHIEQQHDLRSARLASRLRFNDGGLAQ
jgi:hypothetical protein